MYRNNTLMAPWIYISHMGLCPFCYCHSGTMCVSIIYYSLSRGTCPKSIQKVKEMTLKTQLYFKDIVPWTLKITHIQILSRKPTPKLCWSRSYYLITA